MAASASTAVTLTPRNEPDVVARRLISWLSQTPLILEGCDYNFYRRFLRSINRQVRHLRRTAFDGRPGLPRLHVMIALASTALSTLPCAVIITTAGRSLSGVVATSSLTTAIPERSGMR